MDELVENQSVQNLANSHLFPALTDAVTSYNKEQMALDSGYDEIHKMANDLNMKLTPETKDYLTQYYLQEQSNKTAWERQMTASNTQYQRAVEDLKKAGLNPFLAIQSLSGSAPSASGSSVTGGIYTERRNAKSKNSTEAGSKVLSVLALIAAAVIGAMA